ncbi:MAG TPA: hypothetical protein ENN22_04900 [bacterium]|nr:hypothetical protein [bacterium]
MLKINFDLITGRMMALIILMIFTSGLLFSQQTFSQQAAKQQIFQEVENLFSQAKSEQADLLSPNNFKKAIDKYENAKKDFNNGKNIDKNLVEIKAFLEKAIQIAKIGQLNFENLLRAREDALEANAVEFAKDKFEKAESNFLDAAKTLENESFSKAKEMAPKIEEQFRDAELSAIKVSIIGNVKKMLTQAEKQKVKKYAPETIQKATDLLNSAESILISDRSAKTEAKDKAELAEYEVKHAMFLNEKINELRKDDTNWEQLILEHESFFSQILKELGFSPRFDQGFDKPTQSVLKAIKSLKDQNKELSNEIYALDQKIEKLENEKNELMDDLAQLKEKEAGLRTKLTIEQKQKEKFQKIESLFKKDEAAVLREADRIIIRLVGLNFASGKAVINPEHFGLLTKLQRAIKIFPDYQISVEGHTDNRGDDRMNQSLSLKRARAVMAYLIANMGVDESQINAVGYGEDKPLASNQTEQGRAQNRRIDIVLSPPNP